MTGDAEPELYLQTEYDEHNAKFSPDGKWIAYVSDASGHYEVYVASFPGSRGKRQVSTDGGIQPVWSPNGDELFYRSGTKMMVVDIELCVELMLGSPELLFEMNAEYVPAYDVARDGRFVMIQETEPNPPPDHLILVQNFAEELKRLVPNDN